MTGTALDMVYGAESSLQCIKKATAFIKGTTVDEHLDVWLACDASAYGIGVVVYHVLPNGTEKPVGFASQTISTAESKYSQIKKEAFAYVFGIKKFDLYLYGRSFTLHTDHKPLLTLFSNARAVSLQVSSPIQCCSLLPLPYEYTIISWTTQQHANDDALSFLLLPEAPAFTITPPKVVFIMDCFKESFMTAKQIAPWTLRSPSIAVMCYETSSGWMAKSGGWANPTVLEEMTGAFCAGWLHSLGKLNWCSTLRSCTPVSWAAWRTPWSIKDERLALSLLWWPGLGDNIESKVMQCNACQEQSPDPAPMPLHPWSWQI